MSAARTTRTHPPDVRVVAEPGRVRHALAPLPRRILAALVTPGSATTLAERLGLSRQKVNYHLRVLERAGFVTLDRTRRRRGCTERILRLTARRFLIDPTVLGGAAEPDAPAGGEHAAGDRAVACDRFSGAQLFATAARTIREVATLIERAARSRRRLLTFTLDAELSLESPRAYAALTEDLTAALAGVLARHDRPGSRRARRHRVALTLHPIPKQKNGPER